MTSVGDAKSFWPLLKNDEAFGARRGEVYADWHPRQECATDSALADFSKEWVEQEKEDIKDLLETLGETQLHEDTAKNVRKFTSDMNFRACIEGFTERRSVDNVSLPRVQQSSIGT